MTERQPIEIVEHSRKACDLLGYNEKHSRRMGEPISAVSDVDLRLYQVALMEHAGVPKEDARRTFKELRKRASEGDVQERHRIHGIVNAALESLGIPENHPVAELAPAAVKTEKVVFSSRR